MSGGIVRTAASPKYLLYDLIAHNIGTEPIHVPLSIGNGSMLPIYQSLLYWIIRRKLIVRGADYS